jgi:hypothetical protein
MTDQFHHVQICRWHDCSYWFAGRTCRAYSNHVTEHVIRMKSHQCLWNSCSIAYLSQTDLAYHLSKNHCIPNKWIMLKMMAYWYEHDLRCRLEQQWEQHIRVFHFPNLGNYCGIMQLGGLVIVAAHCLFCLGDTKLASTNQYSQFADAFTLNKHMGKHILQLAGLLSLCPHPTCAQTLA